MAPIRKAVDRLTADPEPLTLRGLVEWYKAIGRSDLLPLTADERQYVDARWSYLVQKLATQERVPVGWLSAAISDLAQYELRLLQTAMNEAAAVGDVG